MRLFTLVENTQGQGGCICEHGLSIYIETQRHRLLVDCGQTDAVVSNARALGIDLAAVDTVILSHGHYDHSGGILPFSQVNKTARIIMHRKAPEPHFNGDRYIGIDEGIMKLPNVELIDGDRRFDDELFVFSGITGRRCFPQGNLKLKMLAGGEKVCDDFSHEQCVVISHGGKNILISGCAHNGILNILDRYRGIFGGYPDYVISGFHMMKRDGEHTPEEISVIEQTARELCGFEAVFYSGHCTGEPAFERMKAIMGNRLQALHSGDEIELR